MDYSQPGCFEPANMTARPHDVMWFAGGFWFLIAPRSRLPICGRQVNMASLAYRYRGAGFSSRTVAQRLPSSLGPLPSSVPCAPTLASLQQHSLPL
jgi:hypothetical protein